MNLTEKNKSYLIGASSLAAILILLLLIGEIILPFIFAIFVAYLLNPIILKIQKKIKNRYLAISSFLFVFTLLFVGIIFFFGAHMVKDTKRLVSSVEHFTNENDTQIKEIKSTIINFVDKTYDNEAIKTKIENPKDLVTEENEKKLVSTLESVYSFFEGSLTKKEDSNTKSWSAIYMLFYTLFYSIIILFSYEYFEEKYIKYFSNRKPINKKLGGILNDFKITFIVFFTQRSKVVFLNIVIFIIAFSIMDLPGAIIIGILTGLLSYASHFHYLSLPLVGIGSWVLSTESNLSFFLYFGIALFLFILISILDETVYFEKIMKSVKGMNSAIVLLSFTLWIYVFGAFTGTIIALPLTQLILIYLDRLLLYSQDKSSK
jgi:predicted PurR-regulated permease PerM